MKISKGSQYQFDDEDPAIYSDLEEPHRNFHYEAYPNEQKNFPAQEQRIGYQQFEFNLGGGASGTSGGTGGNKQVLQKIAGLVRQEQALLQEAGVSIPTPPGRLGQQQTGVSLPDPVSEVVPPGPTLSTRAREAGAIPKKKPPQLKSGETTCPVCKAKFTQHSKLKGHYATKHAHTGDFVCGTCLTAFSSQSALESHKKIHEKFKCQLQHSAQAALTCPKFFDTLEALKAHLDSNSVYAAIPDDHKCQYCLKAFTGKTPLDNLKKHVKYRCTLNPNVSLENGFCKFCGKRYHEQKYFKDHERKCPVGQSKGGFRGRGKGKQKGR